MARYGKSSHRKKFKRSRVVKSQRRFVETICHITGRTFRELANFARLPYKPPSIKQLRYDEADILIQYCYANINDLKKGSY